MTLPMRRLFARPSRARRCAFVAVKSVEQQSVLMLHRTRELLVRQRTMLVNATRAHMAEFGVVARTGLPQVKELLAVISDEADERIPPLARTCLEGLARQLLSLEREIVGAERRIHAWHRTNEESLRLETTPGIGPITASALASSIANPSIFKSGRSMAAWIGLVPRQNSTGGKERMGRISKQGDQYLRWLLVAGAMTVIRHAKRRGTTDPMACQHHRRQADQGRGRGAGQQERPHCLGASETRRNLSQARDGLGRRKQGVHEFGGV